MSALAIAKKPASLAVHAKSSPVASHLRAVLAPAADLREENGKLSAKRIAELFGVSLTQLATLLGRSKQAVSKTPDAAALQPGLLDFARIAQLRAPLESDAAFRQWLRTPSRLLEQRTPLEWILDGRVKIVADFADDMLSGSPT